MRRIALASFMFVMGLGTAVHADEPPPKPDGPTAEQPKGDAPAGEAPKGEPTGEAPAGEEKPLTPEEEAKQRAEFVATIKKELNAIPAGTKGTPIGNEAKIDVPEGWFFVPEASAGAWLELTQNLPDPDMVGVLVREDLEASVYFSFDDIGYVKDDERDLDAEAMMTSMRENEAQANAQRRQRGFGELEMLGWAREPFYNVASNSLEWGVKIKEKGAEPGPPTINYNTRRLGRNGVMSVLLVSDTDKFEKDQQQLTTNMLTYSFVSGKEYASFQQGDRTAEIGLGALVVGGGVAVAAKSGAFKWLWKVLVAGGAGIAALFAKLFRSKKSAAASDE